MIWHVPITVGRGDSTVDLSNYNGLDMRERLALNEIQAISQQTDDLIAQYYPQDQAGFLRARREVEIRALRQPIPPGVFPTLSCAAP
jgi:hypothetical protein